MTCFGLGLAIGVEWVSLVVRLFGSTVQVSFWMCFLSRVRTMSDACLVDGWVEGSELEIVCLEMIEDESDVWWWPIAVEGRHLIAILTPGLGL